MPLLATNAHFLPDFARSIVNVQCQTAGGNTSGGACGKTDFEVPARRNQLPHAAVIYVLVVQLDLLRPHEAQPRRRDRFNNLCSRQKTQRKVLFCAFCAFLRLWF
jgi:hypothetical protein